MLETPEEISVLSNKKYRGVDRVPAFRLPEQSPVPGEQEAMEEYVFGKYKDEDQGTIQTLAKAKELLRLFRSSPRAFEIVYCRAVHENAPDASRLPDFDPAWPLLGFDVAGGWDFSSIVAHFPLSPETQEFFAKLNDSGLFPDAETAHRYMSLYRELRLPDYDRDCDVLEVRTVSAGGRLRSL